MKINSKYFVLILIVVAAFGAFMRLYGIIEQPPFADEVLMAFTAQGYMEGGQTLPTMPFHPNMRNLLVSASLWLFGQGSIGIRGFSLFFGIFSVPLLGMLVWKITGRRLAASLAAFFLAVDPLHITFSRQAIQETHVLFFALLGVYIVMVFLERESAAKNIFLLPLAGLVFGLGIASKYQAVFPLIICLCIVLYKMLLRRDAAMAALALLSFTVIPVTVLAITDVPWFTRGYGLHDWLFMRQAVFERMSSKYVPALMELNPDRAAWEWFIKPFTGYSSFSISEGKKVLAVGMGNPMVWMLVLPAVAYAAKRSSLRKEGALLQAFFWLSYLPFIFTNRPIFFLTALAAAPYAFALVALALEDFALQANRQFLPVYLLVVLGISLLMLPLCTGSALDYKYTTALSERFNPHPEVQLILDR